MNVVVGDIPSDDQADGRDMQARRVVGVGMPGFDYDKVKSLLDRPPAMASKFYRSLARFLSNRLRQTTTDMGYAREKNLRHF